MPSIAPAIIHYDTPELDDIERGQVDWAATPARVTIYQWRDDLRRLVIVDQLIDATVTQHENGTTEFNGESTALGANYGTEHEPVTIRVEPRRKGCCK